MTPETVTISKALAQLCLSGLFVMRKQVNVKEFGEHNARISGEVIAAAITDLKRALAGEERA